MTFSRTATLLALGTLLSSPLSGESADPGGAVAPKHTESLTLGGGCFWCLDALFQKVGGVEKIICGYAGGVVEKPTYKQVCGGDTGHAEVVQLVFDPAKISRKNLLEVFWEIHDPTTLNRQGADAGTQYRSVIFYTTPEEKALAEKSRAAAQKNFREKIVTEIVPLKKFWPAEDYHQDYFNKNPNQPYCAAVIAPKVRKFLKR